MAPWKYFTSMPPSPTRHNLVDVVKLPSPGAVILAEVQRLLAEGADVNQTNGDGQTALLWVSNMNDGVAIATVLIEAGADVNKADNWSHTPMYYACLHGLVTMTQLLSSHGASRTLTIKIPEIKRTLEETAVPVDGVDELVDGVARVLRAPWWAREEGCRHPQGHSGAIKGNRGGGRRARGREAGQSRAIKGNRGGHSGEGCGQGAGRGRPVGRTLA